jgi:serine/threonine protein kinase
MRMLKNRGRVTEAEVRYFLAQISHALVYLKSKRIIHRDLKLSNLLLDRTLQVKIGMTISAWHLSHTHQVRAK